MPSTKDFSRRIEILDELAIKLGRNNHCESFEDYLEIMDNLSVILLVRQAMAKYELQGIEYQNKIDEDSKAGKYDNTRLLIYDELNKWCETTANLSRKDFLNFANEIGKKLT